MFRPRRFAQRPWRWGQKINDFDSHLPGVGDATGEGGGGGHQGPRQIDLALGVPHAPREIAIARGEAPFPRREDSQVPPQAGAAGGGGDHGPRFDEDEDAIEGLGLADSAGHSTALSMDLERAVATLPPRARAVLVLCDVEGWKHEEIAAELGMAVGSSKAQLHRARHQLRERLGVHA